jgi:pyrimidine operon attenuation protein / uracil phosphoribosyltransferase
MNEDAQSRGDLTILMDAPHMAQVIRRMAQEILNVQDDIQSVVLLGILTRGRPLADRLAAAIGEMGGTPPRVGSLATTLYRDDLRSGKIPANIGGEGTHFDFNVDGQVVILVDDVIAAGRTARAALDEVMDYGRPARIELAALVDRRVREVPIQPDYRGWVVSPEADGKVAVRLQETDGEDVVFLELATHQPQPEDK